MKFLLAALFLLQTAQAAELSPILQRLVSCQDSWLDWRDNDAKITQFVAALDAQFKRDDKKRVHVPIGKVTYLGADVIELTPESAGMGVGFSITVKAPLDKVRKAYETAVGRPLGNCDSSDGLTFCGVELEPKKTAMAVMPTQRPDVGTLLGCFYLYEK